MLNISHTAEYEAERERSHAIRAALPGACVATRHHALDCQTYDPHMTRPHIWCAPCLAHRSYPEGF